MFGFTAYGSKALNTNFPDKRQIEHGGKDEPGVPDGFLLLPMRDTITILALGCHWKCNTILSVKRYMDFLVST